MQHFHQAGHRQTYAWDSQQKSSRHLLSFAQQQGANRVSQLSRRPCARIPCPSPCRSLPRLVTCQFARRYTLSAAQGCPHNSLAWSSRPLCCRPLLVHQSRTSQAPAPLLAQHRAAWHRVSIAPQSLRIRNPWARPPRSRDAAVLHALTFRQCCTSRGACSC